MSPPSRPKAADRRGHPAATRRGALAGAGIGLRAAHAAELLARRPPLSFVELLSDNHLAPGGPTRWQARAVAAAYPVTLHGVGLSLGSREPFDRTYLKRLRELTLELDAVFVSDHVAFTRVAGVEFHDLLPLPGTEEALDHLVCRAQEAQDRLGRQLLLENPSRYLPDVTGAIPEHVFLNELCRRSGCGLLLDVNNAYVSQHNLGQDARAFLAGIAAHHIGYAHVAGHEARDGLLVDSHGAPVAAAVWALLAELAQRIPGVPVLVERDRNLPPLAALLAEARRAQTVVAEALRDAA